MALRAKKYESGFSLWHGAEMSPTKYNISNNRNNNNKKINNNNKINNSKNNSQQPSTNSLPDLKISHMIMLNSNMSLWTKIREI